MATNRIDRVWTQSEPVQVDLLRGMLFTEEVGAHTFRVSGRTAQGAALPLSGTVLAKFLRSDNVTIDVSGSVSGGVASVTMVRDCYNVPGRFSVVIYLASGGASTVIYAAIGEIGRGSSGAELDSGAPVPSLPELLDAYNNVLSATAAARAELMTLGEQISYFSELSARLGAKTVYADLPGIWKTDGTLNPNAGVHTRMIPVTGYTKIYGRTYMDHWGVAVAYFDKACEYMASVSIPGSDETPNLLFGNTSATEPLTIPEGAAYCSVSGWGTATDYPILFWGPLAGNADIESFHPGVRSTGTVEHLGVSYVDFGAYLDGVHDDTDAVIACHDFANAHGCPVYNHRGTVYMETAMHRYNGRRHNVQIKTDTDWTGTVFLIQPPIEDERVVFAVAPDEDYDDVTLTAAQIAELNDHSLNIGFLRTDAPNMLVTFKTDICIGKRDGEPTYTEPSYYSESAAVDRNGGLMSGALFRAMTDAGSVTMVKRSILDAPITIKGGTFLRGTGNRFVNPYYLYITRSNVTVEGLKVDAGPRSESGDNAYRAELLRADYAYNLCFRDCVCENFGNFYPWADRYSNNVSYVLVCTHCENILIDHCQFLRGWGPIQTSWCKRMTVRDSTMGRVDNHYGCRDYLIEGCTMVTSHSNINVGYGDGHLTIRDCKFIKTRDYDTMMNSRLIYCREDMCAIFSGSITVENIQIETDYETTVLYAAMERDFAYKAADTDKILPAKLPRVRMKDIHFRHVSASPVNLRLIDYGAPAAASAVAYGPVAPDDVIIDGVWSDQVAYILPMLENVARTGAEKWMIRVLNYNCAITVIKRADIDPDEDLDVDRPLVWLIPDSALALSGDMNVSAADQAKARETIRAAMIQDTDSTGSDTGLYIEM